MDASSPHFVAGPVYGIVRLANDLALLLEIKGYEVHEQEKTNPKHQAAQRWVTAVNNFADFSRWEFLVCRDVEMLLPKIGEILGTEVAAVSLRKEGDLL